MSGVDAFFSDLKKKFRDKESIDWESAVPRLVDLVCAEITESKIAHEYNKLFKVLDSKKDVRILDYGCGEGRLVTFLLLDGYDEVYGVDVVPQEMNNSFIKNLGINKKFFYPYDKKKLPFDNEFFDIVISQQVLEHVHNLDDYYSEASRVLKKGGIALLDFPHRLIPFDSHSRKWFIHYFPEFIKKHLYNRFTEKGYAYYDELLNFKTLYFHRKVALKYFSLYKNKTRDRIKNFNYSGVYEGNARLRKLADGLVHSRVFGPVFLFLFSQIAIADIELVK
ncbi:MAG: class I SAM-dependent methyltransferase [Thermodesulfobacteriota bacterium]|nr:class I SAM-dependent methyltransferase [Thermodesulfobacteriota bacterium]